jgi:hypothetical protein
MKLITEATLDDTFNKQMMKIQDAIEALEKMPAMFTSQKSWPVSSQVRALEIASKDLDKLAIHFAGLRT